MVAPRRRWRLDLLHDVVEVEMQASAEAAASLLGLMSGTAVAADAFADGDVVLWCHGRCECLTLWV